MGAAVAELAMRMDTPHASATGKMSLFIWSTVAVAGTVPLHFWTEIPHPKRLMFGLNTTSSNLVSAVSSASISDAMAERFSHRWHVLDLVSPTPGAIVHGWAAPVRFVPRRDDLRDPARHDFAPVIESAGAGDGRILVIACGSYRDAAVAGGKKLTLVEVLGFRGLITDGRVRDFDEAAELNLVTRCAGETVLADRSELMAFEAGVPVELAGALVVPGDWIYSDAAGTVVVPGDHLEEVLKAAVAREAADAREVQRIRGEHSEN